MRWLLCCVWLLAGCEDAAPLRPDAGAAPDADAAAPAPTQSVIDGPVRVTVIAPDLFRLEYEPGGTFEDRPTFDVVKRDLGPVEYTTTVEGGWRTIVTSAATLRYELGAGPFSASNVELELSGQGAPIAPFGAPAAQNLGGWTRGLDGVQGAHAMHDGLLSRSGWYLLDDTASPVFVGDTVTSQSTDKARSDGYLFAYGTRYTDALGELSQLTGPPVLLPRWAFGVWFSRYYAYTASDYATLVARFASEATPLDVLVTDTDWKSPSQWNGWSWNPALFPDPPAFLASVEGWGLRLALNVHPSITAEDPSYATANSAAGGLASVGTDLYAWDLSKPAQASSYFALHAPYDTAGVRLWWHDWCCEPSPTAVAGIPPDTWINRLYAARADSLGLRGFAFSRIGAAFAGYGNIDVTSPGGPWAEHRYSLHFTGDTGPTWDVLRYEIGYTAAEGNIGLPWVTHDLGSFSGNHLADDLYVRWVQLGVFQPIFRLHSNHGDRLPWDYDEPAHSYAVALLQMREALVPYTYTLARQAHDTGLPIVRSLYLTSTDDEAYAHPEEFFFGPDLFVAPVYTAGDPAPLSVSLPAGAWRDYFTGEAQPGAVTLDLMVPLSSMVVYARQGAIVTLAPPVLRSDAAPLDTLVVRVFTGADGDFTLYEDEGEGHGYETGAARTTALHWRQPGTLTIDAAAGTFPGAVATRAYKLELMGQACPTSVRTGGVALAASAWTCASNGVTVNVPAQAVTTATIVSLD